MMKCFQGFKLFGIFLTKSRHSFIISNAFYTLENPELCDIIKTCQACGAKEAFSTDRNTLLELVELYPNAFNSLLREYLITWKR